MSSLPSWSLQCPDRPLSTERETHRAVTENNGHSLRAQRPGRYHGDTAMQRAGRAGLGAV